MDGRASSKLLRYNGTTGQTDYLIITKNIPFPSEDGEPSTYLASGIALLKSLSRVS